VVTGIIRVLLGRLAALWRWLLLRARTVNWRALLAREGVQAFLILGLLLNVLFFPALWGGRTLMTGVWDAPSITPSGAYHVDPLPKRVGRTPDPGAPAWQTEPWFKIISHQLLSEHRLPLWNPYAAYGTPLAAAMQPQPYYPLTALLALHTTPTTYSFFIVGRLLVAGLLMFFFTRLFLDRAASTFAAVTFMLTGYFIMFLNMPHLSVEVLLPGVFLTVELLLRKNSWEMVAWAAVAVFLCVLGGMPESLFLVVAFACVYFAFRIAITPEFRRGFIERLAKLFAAIGLGFALSAFLLLPFLEFMRVAHDTHQLANVGGDRSGLAVDGDTRTLILYLVPLIFGPVGNSIFSNMSGWTGSRSYWGILPCIFAVAALLYYLAPRNTSTRSPLRWLAIFFAVCFALMLLKRFGHPIINWIGRLPISELIVYVKYQEPMMAFCLAFVAGLGVALLAKGRASQWYFIAAALIMLAVTLWLASWSLPRALEMKDFAFVYYLTLLAAVLVVLGACVFFSLPPGPPLAWAFVAMLCAELAFNFIVPSFYMFNTAPPARANPYAGAPYVDFIRSSNKDHSRVFAREGVLFPNWSGVFELADARTLDGMFYRRYMDFIRNFLLKPGDEGRRHGDLADRFTGSEGNYPYAFNTEAERRFLALSSIKYLAGTSAYDVDPAVVDGMLTQNKLDNRRGFGRVVFRMPNGKSIPGLHQHPPSSRAVYRTVIDPRRPIFEAIAAVQVDAHDKSDGVGFLIELRSGGKIEKLFSATLNPKDVPADRAGKPVRLDLSAYAGKEVELLFSTDPGPNNNDSFDWAGWVKPRFVSKEGFDPDTVKEVYSKEVSVYEVPRTLPRAALFRSVELLADRDVLARLKDPAFDIYGRIILSKDGLSKEELAALQPLEAAAPAPAAAARVVSYESQRVRIEAETPTAAVLMLNDANYPGWRAYVNGRQAPILSADYLFRGVLLPAGRSVVEFSYEPGSFRLGLAISFAALAALGGIAVLSRRRREAAPPRPQAT
jgi:hypothetical protein